MYNYPNNYNSIYYTKSLQDMRDQIDKQLQQQQQIQQQQQPQQQPQINQTFQLSSPQQNINDFDCKYMESIDDVKKALVFRNSIFVNKDMSTMWLKDTTGAIRTFALSEVIEKDEKDIQIENLTEQVNELKAILLSNSNCQNKALYYQDQQVNQQDIESEKLARLISNEGNNNMNVIKKNKGDVKNEQRNNKYNDEQLKKG